MGLGLPWVVIVSVGPGLSVGSGLYVTGHGYRAEFVMQGLSVTWGLFVGQGLCVG